jgi:hypothetical protein
VELLQLPCRTSDGRGAVNKAICDFSLVNVTRGQCCSECVSKLWLIRVHFGILGRVERVGGVNIAGVSSCGAYT